MDAFASPFVDAFLFTDPTGPRHAANDIVRPGIFGEDDRDDAIATLAGFVERYGWEALAVVFEPTDAPLWAELVRAICAFPDVCLTPPDPALVAGTLPPLHLVQTEMQDLSA